MPTDEQIVKQEYDEAYKQSWSYWGAFLREAKKDHHMVMGDQWPHRREKVSRGKAGMPMSLTK